MTEERMTNEEAIERIKDHMAIHKMNEPRAILISEALEMAIAVLKAEPCEDAVSRKAVLKKIFLAETSPIGSDNILKELSYSVENMPPVTPKQRTGKWMDDKCSVCGKGIEDLISSPEWYRNEEPKFCPYCGVKLGGESE